MRRLLPLILLVTVAAAPESPAKRRCKVPVFRYALERWRASPYEAYLFHRGKLGEAERATIKALRDSYPANVFVEPVDLGADDVRKELLQLWEAQGDAPLPSLVLLFPGQRLDEPPAWRGRPDPAIVPALIDSPVRREVSKRILAGESAVWILLESGDKDADAAAAKLLETELKDLQETLEVPALKEIEEDPNSPELLAEVPLRLAFSMVRLKRDDPKERAFVEMILSGDPRMAKKPVPVALPVIGRGRALPPLFGETLNADQIFQASDFLTGACSCQVKELNPGIDLLFKTDWEAVLAGFPLEEPLPIPGQKVAIPPGTQGMSETGEAPGTDPRIRAWTFLAFASMVGLILITRRGAA